MTGKKATPIGFRSQKKTHAFRKKRKGLRRRSRPLHDTMNGDSPLTA